MAMMEAQDEAWPFQEPVSAEEVPDYYTLVKVQCPSLSVAVWYDSYCPIPNM